MEQPINATKVQSKRINRLAIVRDLIVLTVLLTGIGAGTIAMCKHDLTPGAQVAVKSNWPPASAQRAPLHHPVLMVFVHPRCPCSRATLANLAQLVGKPGVLVDARVVFVCPPGAPSGWEQGALWNSASTVRGVQCIIDVGGREARLFGARTSGQTLLYSSNGVLQFRGGITEGRGAEGESVGSDAVRTILAGHPPRLRQTPVFGCELGV